MFRSSVAVTLVSLLAALPAQAAAPACWNREDIAAAKVRDLDTLLTEMSARCVAAGLSGADGYDAYAVASRGPRSAVRQRLKARFWTVYGAAQGGERLAGFLDLVSSQYARVPAVAENCAQVAGLAREAAASGGSVAALLAIAERSDLTPPLPGGPCRVAPVKVAAR